MKKKILSWLLIITMVLGLFPTTAFAAEDVPITVTADGSEVQVTGQGSFLDKQYWGSSYIPVYYAKVSETAAINITYSGDYLALDSAYYSSLEQSALAGVNKDYLEDYFVTASDYYLDTENSVAYIEFATNDGYYTSAFGLLVEFAPVEVTTYTVELPEGEGYNAAATGGSESPVEAGGSYSFTVTVADDYDGTNMVVKANEIAMTAAEGVYTIENINANQTVTITGVEKKPTGPVSVTADGSTVGVTGQGSFLDKQYWGSSYIPVYYAKVSETAAINITYSGDYLALDSAYYSSLEQSALAGVNKDYLEDYFVTASDYYLDTENSVAYIEFATNDGYYTSAFGLLIELEPASGGSGETTTYKVTLPTETDEYTVKATEGSKSPVNAGGSYSFTVTVADDYDGSNMEVKANNDVLTADENGVYTIENIGADQIVAVTGVEKKPEQAATYKVTLPTETDGYTVKAAGESASPVEAGGSYSFTVSVVYGYDASAMKVMANGSELTAIDGVYTIENIQEDKIVTVTDVEEKKVEQTSDYITVSIEKYDTNGNGSVLLNPKCLPKDAILNDYVVPILQKAMGKNSYVDYDTEWIDGTGTVYTITGIYDESQADSYLDNGDQEGYKWQVLVNNEAWSGRDYNTTYKLNGGDVVRCIYTNETAAGQTNKDALVQLAATVSDEVKQKDAYEAALSTIVSRTASATDVENAIKALEEAKVVQATSVEITAGDSVDLKVNKTLTLEAAVRPANTTELVWSSSNSDVVKVDASSGQITGVSAGTATVTATSGSASDSITVNVTAIEATGVTITNGDVSVEARFSIQLEATVEPEDSTELVEWSVADPDIARVDANGKLTGIKEGETTVTAKAGEESDTVKVTVEKTISPYVYFEYTDKEKGVQEMYEDTFTLTALDEGTFKVGNITGDTKWSCSEYVANDDGTYQYNYWINSAGKYQPHGVKEMTATVQVGGFNKTFTINTVSSGITDIRAYIGNNYDEEMNEENSYEVIGMVSGIPVTARGLKDGEWVYIPTQALQITSGNTNIARLVGNQMSLIYEGSTQITVSMMDDSEVSTSFNAICNTVKVTKIEVNVPETFVIDKWDSMGNVFIGIYKGYDDPNTQYSVSYWPSNATNQNLIWEDLTPEIAEYDEGWSTGIVPKKAGTAKFKVISKSNPDVYDEVSINFVYKNPLERVSAKANYEMKVYESLDPELTFTPSNATETRFNWTYSQDGIVQVKESVTSSGYSRVVSRKIVALKNGTVTVTGTPVDDSKGCKPVVFTVTVSGDAQTETIDYNKMAMEDLAHGLEYLGTQTVQSYGNEWTIFTNLRAGNNIVDFQSKVNYLQSVASQLKNSEENMDPTDYARLVLTLPLLDVDPQNFEGVDIVEKLYNNTTLDNQTSNQICWTLLALDSMQYDIPENALWNRDKLIEKILTFQSVGGGFALYADGSMDVDTTGMILQSLAPYYNSDYPDVQKAVNNALEYMKGQMTENVGYINGGAENACTAAQVLTALASLGIDPTDSANGFTIGNKTLITNLHGFERDSGFAYLLGENYKTNLMGTQQITYALEAYRRYADGENSLYDLTDLNGGAVAVTYNVTLPAGGEGYTVQAADGSASPVNKYGKYTFTVKLADGYTKGDDFAVKANGSLLTESEGKYTIIGIISDQTITVEGVRKVVDNETFAVSLPGGEGYTVKAADGSESPVKYDESYSFTVTIAEGYEKTSEFAVKANGTTLTENNGKYTIENIREKQTVTVTGVKQKAGTIKVRFSLLGCYEHDEGENAVHTLAAGNLQTWVEEKEYSISADSTVWDLLKSILSENDMTCSNPTENYVESITRNGTEIGEFTNGSLSGWLFTVNGIHGNFGVSEQEMKDGDVIIFHYTDDYTAELEAAKIIARKEIAEYKNADDYRDAQKAELTTIIATANKRIDAVQTEIDVRNAVAEAKAAMDKIKTDAQLTLEEAATVEEAKGLAKKEIAEYKDASDYRDAQKAELSAAIEKANDAIDAAETKEEIIKSVEEAKAAMDKIKTDEQLTLEEAIIDIDSVYKATGDYLAEIGTPSVGSVGGEWMAIGLARSGRTVSSGYYENAADYVKENINKNNQLHASKSTDNARLILALTAAGYDPRNISGYNLLEGLTDLDYVKKQGINGPIWALIAFDSHDYDIPASDADNPVTRTKLIDTILAAQLTDGGWALSGNTADTDMTGMALQALAPYYSANDQVKAAVDKALTTLSAMQNEYGSFGSVDGQSSESCAQVIVALTALGINPDTDSRFVKNGRSVVDALCAFAVEDGGFAHVMGEKRDGMATEQSYYALTAYMRFLNKDTSLYDMSDVTLKEGTSSGTDTTNKKDQEAADAVEDLIEAIGKVTVNSGLKIQNARTAYDKLTSAQKKLVGNYADLTAAEADYDEAKAEYVEDLIDAIGTVTVNSETRIKKARNAYNKLTSAQKKLVENYEDLKDAEDDLEDAKVEYVEDLIDSIGTVTLNSKTKISRARTAYNNLSSSNKKDVSNLDVLEAAEAAYAELQAASKTTTKTTTATKKTTSAAATKTVASQAESELTVIAGKVKGMLDSLNAESMAGEIYDAILAYEELTEDEKESIGKVYLVEELKEQVSEINQTDTKTGIGVSGCDWNIQIVVDDVLDITQVQLMKEQVGGNQMLGLWDIYLEDSLSGEKYAPEGTVLVKIPLALLGDYSAYDGLAVVHYTDDGKVEYLNCTIVGDCIAFNTVEFSNYAVVGYNGASPVTAVSSGAMSNDAETADNSWLPWVLACGCGIAFLAVLFLFAKKSKEQNQSAE